MGDFNISLKAQDKNNRNFNRRIMGSFRSMIDRLDLKEIKLNGRRFTWSNERGGVALYKLDRMFCSSAWDGLFPACALHVASTMISDHCPMLLIGEQQYKTTGASVLRPFGSNCLGWSRLWPQLGTYQCGARMRLGPSASSYPEQLA